MDVRISRLNGQRSTEAGAHEARSEPGEMLSSQCEMTLPRYSCWCFEVLLLAGMASSSYCLSSA